MHELIFTKWKRYEILGAEIVHRPSYIVCIYALYTWNAGETWNNMISGHVGFCRGRCDDIAESDVVGIDCKKSICHLVYNRDSVICVSRSWLWCPLIRRTKSKGSSSFAHVNIWLSIGHKVSFPQCSCHRKISHDKKSFSAYIASTLTRCISNVYLP